MIICLAKELLSFSPLRIYTPEAKPERSTLFPFADNKAFPVMSKTVKLKSPPVIFTTPVVGLGEILALEAEIPFVDSIFSLKVMVLILNPPFWK